jgi:hypothetical protein
MTPYLKRQDNGHERWVCRVFDPAKGRVRKVPLFPTTDPRAKDPSPRTQ